MATEIVPGGMTEWRSASTAGGGTALTSTATRIPIPRGTKQIVLIPRNFSTAVVVKYNLNPFLTILKTTDLLATSTNITDYSEAAQDLSTSTKVTLNSFDTIANSNALYIGSWLPFGGVDVDVNNTNSNASVLTVKYWKQGSPNAWADISASDGTTTGGHTFGQDGLVTWTVPSDWQSARLISGQANQNYIGDTNLRLGIAQEELYWTRWEVSAALDSTTDCNSMISINRDTTYAELPSTVGMSQAISVGRQGLFSVTALTDAGTANLIVNCSTRTGGRF